MATPLSSSEKRADDVAAEGAGSASVLPARERHQDWARSHPADGTSTGRSQSK